MPGRPGPPAPAAWGPGGHSGYALRSLRICDKFAGMPVNPSPFSGPHPSAALEALLARCARGGLPLTVQRRAILGALAGRQDHPSAEAVFEATAAALPGVSRATVYRALEAMVGAGCLRRVADPGRAARYDPNVARHHHLVCESCGRIEDLEEPALDHLPLPGPPAECFEVRDYSVYFTGRCQACAGAGPPGPS